jgi:hypothetical protein
MTKTLKFLSEVNLVRSCISGSGAKGGFPACVSGVGIHPGDTVLQGHSALIEWLENMKERALGAQYNFIDPVSRPRAHFRVAIRRSALCPGSRRCRGSLGAIVEFACDIPGLD